MSSCETVSDVNAAASRAFESALRARETTLHAVVGKLLIHSVPACYANTMTSASDVEVLIAVNTNGVCRNLSRSPQPSVKFARSKALLAEAHQRIVTSPQLRRFLSAVTEQSRRIGFYTPRRFSSRNTKGQRMRHSPEMTNIAGPYARGV